ncbi:nuclease-related domain-containing protein [Nocardioides sp. BYT-33-1]|uniref:nuclease-related domain-containing protein n=1 Tax=Nocardioides sp. BYT-33-1 TaxID=3416952 RepID=UPI003F536307
MMGDEAERWTAQELRRLVRHDRDSFVVNRVPMDGHDIDHVLLTQAGLFIIETKWSSERWTDTAGIERRNTALQQVQRAGRRLMLWSELRRLITAHSVPVTWIVVLWGGDREETIKPEVGHDYAVLEGHDLRGWIGSRPTISTPGGWTTTAWTALDRYIAMREAHDPSLAEIPRSAAEHASRLGISTAVAVITFLSLGWLLTTTSSVVVLVTAALAAAAGAATLRRRRLLIPIANGVLATAAGVGVLLLAAILTSSI